MDVDLSTDLAALLPLVAPLLSGHSDLAIGTRLARGSRGRARRQARDHLPLLQPAAARRRSAARVLRRPVRLQGDPRRPARASCCRWSRTPAGSSTPSCSCSPSAPGCASTRCPVDWVDDPDSRVDIVRHRDRRPQGHRARSAAASRTAGSRWHAARPAARRGRAGRRRRGSSRQLVRFGRHRRGQHARLRGAVPAAARRLLGAVRPTRWRCCVTAVANTAANRRLTFGVRGAAGRLRHQAQGLVVFAIGLARHQRQPAGCCTPLDPGAGRARRARRAHRRQRRRHAAALRAVPRPGSSRAATASPAPAPDRSPMTTTDQPATPCRGRPEPDAAPPPRVPSSPPAGATDGAATRRCAGSWRGRPRPTPPGSGRRCSRCSSPPALLYLSGLGRSGWANAFYSAAVQAGTESWKAFFFGSFDAANFITVDKPPASLWVMELSARALRRRTPGASSCPQALRAWPPSASCTRPCGAGSAPAAGLLAGAVLALTPVATLMFRFNNPDALLVLLLTAGGVRDGDAGDRARPHAAGSCSPACSSGSRFLAKMLQAFLVRARLRARLPGRRADRAAAPRSGTRCWPAPRMVVAGGWWVAVVELWPAASRPYIGGSQTNSVLELIFGYNGFGRLTGNETGSVVPGGGRRGGAGAWGATGLGRLFNASWGGQIAWLLPAALVFVVALLVAAPARAAHRPHARRRAPLGRLAARHRASSSASRRASSTSTTRWPWRRRSARSSASARSRSGRAARTLGRAPRAGRRPRRRPPSGRSSCSTARPTGSRGCASPCWPRGLRRGRRARRRRPAGAAGRAGARRRGRRGRAGRPRRLLAADRGHRAHRLAAHGRPHRRRRGFGGGWPRRRRLAGGAGGMPGGQRRRPRRQARTRRRRGRARRRRRGHRRRLGPGTVGGRRRLPAGPAGG